MNILITGATKGIGKAIALEMTKQNHALALCARDQKDLDALKKEIITINPKSQIYLSKTDCSNKEQLLSFISNVINQIGIIDVLINNVGVFSPSNILDEDDDQLDFHFKTNVFASYILYKKLAPLMIKQQKGHIFNICSVASLQTIVNAGSYCVTKAAMLSLNNIMREETKPFKVKVTAILPGSTLTSSWDGTTISPDQFIQAEDVAKSIHHIMQLSDGANVDQLLITPQSGQI
ncbi:SDR family oxidoreductase [Pedobacter alpinus]|uniref:SDR family oxidoreductase n=1 Tax=Pedobacter alpinus TaxID=1590643 RepID=A0ABW5TNM3_9SPHI